VGRRSRKHSRTGTPPATPAPPRPRPPAPAAEPGDETPRPAARAPLTPERRARIDEAPKAPWSPFPLVELCILVAIVMILAGFFTSGDRRGLLLGCGFALVSLASIELSLREHFAGYRSHSSLLAGCCAVASAVPLFFLTKLPYEVLLVVAAAIFAIAFRGLRRAFVRRTGGLGFRA
jgi:hypothetical protein